MASSTRRRTNIKPVAFNIYLIKALEIPFNWGTLYNTRKLFSVKKKKREKLPHAFYFWKIIACTQHLDADIKIYILWLMHLKKKFNKSYIIIYKLSIIFHKIIKKNLILNITSKSLKNIYFFNPKNDSTTIVYQFAHHYLSQRNETGGRTFNLINLNFTRLKNLLLTQKKPRSFK